MKAELKYTRTGNDSNDALGFCPDGIAFYSGKTIGIYDTRVVSYMHGESSIVIKENPEITQDEGVNVL
ncbi:MAG: hypothetical protein A2452_06455 [Candidatus Firestonebacteria bacterium RIFOXYC2_FULL_39_67]|nr:MAG: hypothetical protein A2452_06455 [Candidatus Firestonebacteria bacterium RIFOXYC2_FULL_39_67]